MGNTSTPKEEEEVTCEFCGTRFLVTEGHFVEECMTSIERKMALVYDLDGSLINHDALAKNAMKLANKREAFEMVKDDIAPSNEKPGG